MKFISYSLMLLFFYFSSFLEARIYFLHIPKTGGTTLRLLLESELSAHEIYPCRNIHGDIVPVTHELVSGHFPYWFCKKIDKDFDTAVKITILRDPIQRYLSFLRAKKKADITLHDLESVLLLRNSPTKKYHQGLIDNALCRNLAANPHLKGRALLESAIETLNKLDFVIFFDHFSEDTVSLFKSFQIELTPENIPKMNVTSQEPISKELWEEVRQLNTLDIELYAYAKDHFSKKSLSYPLRTDSYKKIIGLTNYIDYSFDFPLKGTDWSYRDTDNQSLTTYRWVMDKPASIYFPLIQEGDYYLYFRAMPLTKEVIPQVKINGIDIEISQIDKKKFSLYKGLIPKELITSNTTKISFFSSKFCEYREIYPQNHNRNYPPLAFAVNRIQISQDDFFKE